jgi:sugar O-acyltransferase (sialic acid O-acetyltransferase NeuD family)
MLDIVIVGAGGFGREVYHWIKDSFSPTEYRIKGFLSRNHRDLDGFTLEERILGDENSYSAQAEDRFLLAIGSIETKKRVVERMKLGNAKFLTLIHPTAVVASSARMGEGVVICPFALISNHVVLGDFVMMNFHSSVGHDTTVGAYSVFSPYATANGFAHLAAEVFLGTHATVTAYRKVGLGAKISANSVAMQDVPARSFVFGVPGKIKTILAPTSEIHELLTNDAQPGGHAEE